jgi:large subunit ribosomal protein L1
MADKKTKKEEIVDTTELVETPVVNTVTAEETEAPTEAREAKVAKAGKRSAKAIEETEEKAAKEDRKASDADEVEKPKQHSNPTRSRLARRGKGFRKSAELIVVDKAYSLDEAIALAKKTSHVKFDASVELHVNLSVDPRQADQNIRDNLVLPAGTGRVIKIAVLTEDDAAALKAGADIAGVDNLLAELEKGVMNFDILICTPALMGRLGKYARALGPRGLMPNPKSGTVTNDVQKAIAEAKAGKVEYRVDSTGIVHLAIGKVSFTEVQLMENVQAVLASIKANKPASIKSTYFKAAHVTTSMGPSINVDLGSIN